MVGKISSIILFIFKCLIFSAWVILAVSFFSKWPKPGGDKSSFTVWCHAEGAKKVGVRVQRYVQSCKARLLDLLHQWIETLRVVFQSRAGRGNPFKLERESLNFFLKCSSLCHAVNAMMLHLAIANLIETKVHTFWKKIDGLFWSCILPKIPSFTWTMMSSQRH